MIEVSRAIKVLQPIILVFSFMGRYQSQREARERVCLLLRQFRLLRCISSFPFTYFMLPVIRSPLTMEVVGTESQTFAYVAVCPATCFCVIYLLYQVNSCIEKNEALVVQIDLMCGPSHQ